MGNTLASLSFLGNFPVATLLFIRAAMLNDNMLATDFIILGPISSNPIALLESKAIIEADTCSGVILVIWKYIPFETLSFTKFVKCIKSGSKLSRLSMPKISEIDEKYSFSLVATFSEDVYSFSLVATFSEDVYSFSLVATFSEDVYRSLFMIISSGKLLSELLSLLLILRKCCQMALVSLGCVTESEKCLRLALLIKSFVLLRYL